MLETERRREEGSIVGLRTHGAIVCPSLLAAMSNLASFPG
jgi:hypothetical protein